MDTFLSVLLVVTAGAALIYAPVGLGNHLYGRVRLRRAMHADPAALDVQDRSEMSFILHSEGQLALERGRPEAAVNLFRQALRLSPLHKEISQNLVYALYSSGQFGPAEAALERHLEAFPHDEAVRLVSGAVACEQGDFVRAREHLDAMNPKALPGPDRALWYNNYAYALASLRVDLDVALEYAKRALELTVSADRQYPLRTLGVVHLARRELADAEQMFREALAERVHMRPGDVEFTHYHLALCLEQQGKLQDARHHLEAVRGGATGYAAKARERLDALRLPARG